MSTFDNGTVIGSYRIVRLLGEGGMGAVYEAEHTQLGVHYAVKTYTLEDKHSQLFRKKFAVEGRLLARLQHPNLVRVIDLDLDEPTGTLYYVMDLVLYKDGYAHTLADLEPGGADEDQIFDWFCQLCSALAYVHTRGIVHRDIKLNNILLAPDKHVVLSDFGISRVFEENLQSEVGTTRTIVSSATQGLVVGTQGYMAPEIERGETATPASDVYALGVVFFKLLTGVWYDKDLEPNAATSSTRVTNASRLLADFERPWKDVLPAMLASDPARRPTDLANLPRLLSTEVASPSGEATSSSLRQEVISSAPRKRTRLIPLCVLAAALLGAAVLVIWFVLRAPASDVPNDEALTDEAFALPESVQ